MPATMGHPITPCVDALPEFVKLFLTRPGLRWTKNVTEDCSRVAPALVRGYLRVRSRAWRMFDLILMALIIVSAALVMFDTHQYVSRQDVVL